ncbi:MAG: vitamin B12 dependent-methionine synthase activation domain-containing protein, partial [Fusobacterium sp.]
EVKKPKVVLEDCESKIKQALIYGGSTTFQEDIQEALKKYSPLTIIQEILMSGMEEVGKMFEVGELYLPQLIRSATVMNNAIDILTPLLAHNEKVTSKGRVVMGTVAGDVHDIGKNIVGTVLKCNGFEIFDLGVMVSKDEIYEKAVEVNADVVTLSGLISPSLKEMEKVLKLFNEKNMNIPILVAGATTSKLHTALKLEPLYEQKVIHVTDALDTLSLVSKICVDTLEREKYLFEKNQELKKLRKVYYENKKMKKPVCEVREKYENKLKVPKKIGKFYLEIPIEKLEKYINWNFILENLKVRKTEIEGKTLEEVRKVFDIMKKNKVIAKATFGIFNCEKNPENDQVKILAQGQEKEINFVESTYKNTKVSLSDFLNEKDYIGAFLISVNSNIFKEKVYEKIIENLILMEAAESSSKYLQDYISERMWEINIRPAIGYNSIPDHSFKKIIFDILDSEKTDATLTETFSMYPLTSVCGFYFSSNDSFYF